MSKYLGKTVETAARIFKTWHQKHATEAEQVDYPLDEYEVFCAGYADNILYASDKWEDDGDFHDYLHEFDSGPAVYVGDDGEEQADPRVIMKNNLNGELALPVLAFVRELIYVRPDGSKRSLRFKSPPVMCCSLDKKALVIMTSNVGPIYIRGGKMHVTERGIHH